MVTSLQGHDLLPREILKPDTVTGNLFRDYLPGYSVNGAYNFVVTGDNPAAALQQDADLRFDLDGDGFLEATGWLSGDDGFLVRDLDRDGAIDDISEMFGARGIADKGPTV